MWWPFLFILLYKILLFLCSVSAYNFYLSDQTNVLYGGEGGGGNKRIKEWNEKDFLFKRVLRKNLLFISHIV